MTLKKKVYDENHKSLLVSEFLKRIIQNIFRFFANRPIIDSCCGNHRQKIPSLDLACSKPTISS